MRSVRWCAGVLCGLFFGWWNPACAAEEARLQPIELRCDWAVNPLGVDSAPPRLSWKLRGQGRDLRQTAWQVLVASSTEKLGRNEGDVWDSGRTVGRAQLHVPYAGEPLRTAQRVYWKVRVWDNADAVSAWSETATWTMGRLDGSAGPAQWISSPVAVAAERQVLGYSSQATDDEAAEKWIQLDLGESVAIDSVRLHALTHTVPERLGFPRWFRLEASDTPEFSRAVLLADHTRDPANVWKRKLTFDGKGQRARYLRLTATKLRRMLENDLPSGAGASVDRERGRLALSQIEVVSAGKNVALGATVTASDSAPEPLWSTAALVDGRGVPGANPRANETVRLRREFRVRPGLAQAVLFVSGLGHYTLHVNGEEVGREWLSPGWTNTDKTVLYDTHDLGARLLPGANAIGLTLAGGMFSVPAPGPDRYTKFIGRERPLMATAELHLTYRDGTTEVLRTDERWSAGTGPVTYAHVYGGIDYDARRETPGWDKAGFGQTEWLPAVLVPGPKGALRGASHAAPPLAAQETLRPVAVRALSPELKVYDLGQNAALSLRLKVRGPAGARVTVIPAELLREDGRVDRGSVGGSEASWNYTLAGHGAGEVWEPRLFYHGARYLEVHLSAPEGGVLPEVETIEGLVVHSDAEAAGDFSCSSDLLNRIRHLVRWAQRSNLSHVLTDCPHRERLGWLEQYHLNGPSLRYEYDLARLFSKTFQDMADAQRPNGLIPSTAPEYVTFEGGFRDSPEWGSALLLASWQHFEWTGDDLPLRRHYDAMVRYVDYLASRAEGDVLSHGLGDWYDLGPERPGASQLTPVPLTATAFHFLANATAAKIATQQERPEDAARFRGRADKIKAAFNRAFLQDEKGVYATGSQTAQALPLVLGLVPAAQRDAAFSALLQDVRNHDYSITAGDVGYRYLLRALAEAGRSDVIFRMTHQTDRPGYGFQLKRGATSLTESWDANRHSSQNHFMLGQITEWFYRDLAGIAVAPDGPGFEHVLVCPQPVGDLRWVQASHQSPRGPIEVHWERGNGRFSLQVSVPPNTEATVSLPVRGEGAVLESGRPAGDQPGVRFVKREHGRAIYTTGSGRYYFETAE